jgi:hypothetical protein
MGVNMTASHHGQVRKITQKLHFVWAKILLCMGLFFVFFGRGRPFLPSTPCSDRRLNKTNDGPWGGSGWFFTT